LDTGFEFLVKGGEEGMGELVKTKYIRVQEYVRLYPEFRFVFLGDNGQGDYAVGHMMHERFPDNLEQVFIHRVQGVTSTPFYSVYASRTDAPVEFVDDYVMAAVSAVVRPRPLISVDGLLRVVLAAEKDFAEITGWSSEDQKRVEEVRLFASIRRARELLHELGTLEEPPAAPAQDGDVGEVPSKPVTVAKSPEQVHAQPASFVEADGPPLAGDAQVTTPATPATTEAAAALAGIPALGEESAAGSGKEAATASSGQSSRSFLTWLPRAVTASASVASATSPHENSCTAAEPGSRSPARFAAKAVSPHAAEDGSAPAVVPTDSAEAMSEAGSRLTSPVLAAQGLTPATSPPASPGKNFTVPAVATTTDGGCGITAMSLTAASAQEESDCVTADAFQATDSRASE